MEQLIAENPKNAEVIFPYIGGEEVNSSPTHAHHRYVMYFGEHSEEESRCEWPKLMAIVEQKVMPERLALKSIQDGIRLKQRWWIHGRTRLEMYTEISSCKRVIVTALHQPNWQLTFMGSGQVFSHALAVFSLASAEWLITLQSTAHECWARFLGSSMKDDLRYTPSDCFETFPFPTALLDSAADDPAHAATRQSLEAIGERYHQFRAGLMVSNNEGLTSTYNRFHDPAETDPRILELRHLHGEMDQEVLNAYGWSDLPTPGPTNSPCGFGLDYLDLDDDVQLPEELQERIDGGDLFFHAAGDAINFDSQLRAATGSKRKLPWRYRWPDAVRDEVLARLLALNAERYAEEVALASHGNVGKQTAKARAGSGAKRLGRPPQTPKAGFDQIGLSL